MKAKLVKESLNENIKTDGFSEGNSFGESKCMEIVKRYFPFIENIQFDDLGQRGTREDPAYGHDEQYSKWDQLSFETGIDKIDEWGPSLYLIQDFDNETIYGKIYLDTVNFNGYGESNDEYTSELDPIPVEEWDEERYLSVIEDLKEYVGYDESEEDEYKESMMTR
jgi:hypothetical protein